MTAKGRGLGKKTLCSIAASQLSTKKVAKKTKSKAGSQLASKKCK